MRKLATICRNLKRSVGRSYCVRGVSRGHYRVYLLDNVAHDWFFVGSFGSVSAVESYLLSKFRL